VKKIILKKYGCLRIVSDDSNFLEVEVLPHIYLKEDKEHSNSTILVTNNCNSIVPILFNTCIRRNMIFDNLIPYIDTLVFQNKSSYINSNLGQYTLSEIIKTKAVRLDNNGQIQIPLISKSDLCYIVNISPLSLNTIVEKCRIKLDIISIISFYDSFCMKMWEEYKHELILFIWANQREKNVR